MDWGEVFILDKNPIELIIRVTVLWWFIFLVLRFVMRRNVGEVGPADVLLLVLVADAASNGMTDDYHSIMSGMIVVGTLFFWSWFIDWAAMRWGWAKKLMVPAPVVLVRNGKYDHRAMKREKVSLDDIEAEFHKVGLEDISQVKTVRYESDGSFSVTPK